MSESERPGEVEITLDDLTNGPVTEITLEELGAGAVTIAQPAEPIDCQTETNEIQSEELESQRGAGPMRPLPLPELAARRFHVPRRRSEIFKNAGRVTSHHVVSMSRLAGSIAALVAIVALVVLLLVGDAPSMTKHAEEPGDFALQVAEAMEKGDRAFVLEAISWRPNASEQEEIRERLSDAGSVSLPSPVYDDVQVLNVTELPSGEVVTVLRVQSGTSITEAEMTLRRLGERWEITGYRLLSWKRG